MSDVEGMSVLVDLFWSGAYQQLPTADPEPQVSPKTSPAVPPCPPAVVVKDEDEAHVPRATNPYEWEHVERGKKVNGINTYCNIIPTVITVLMM